MTIDPNCLNRKVLVTGATGSIGQAISSRLAKDGFHVVLHCRSQIGKAEALRDDIRAAGGQAEVVAFDVTDRARTRKCLEELHTEGGSFFGVVSNSGITRDNTFPALSEDDWDQVLRTNLDGFFNVVQPLIMPMVRARKGGRIVCISSVSGVIGNRGQVNYSASKAGLIGAAKALAVELAGRGITVNAVAPGLIASEMLDSVNLEQALQLIPMKRVGEPSDVAALVGFLFSDSANYITRQVIGVNGGMV